VSSLLKKIDKLPPNLVRVLARDGRAALTNKQISERSGIAVKRIGQISKMKTWGGIQVSEAAAFADACGVDLVNQAKTRKYLMRGPAMAHVKGAINRDYLLSLFKL
jgi:hypothetical protein|tara:strand:+ start:1925 stop:2242 length:318 start_codon:yes stop_codon:yes gene_type:complete